MNNFTFYCPTKFVFGKGQEENVGKLCREQGATKVLIVYGGGSVVRSGLLDRVRKYIQDEGIATVDFGGAKPNPRVEHVREGVEIVKREGIDFLLAIGGGSVIDTAKGIGNRRPLRRRRLGLLPAHQEPDRNDARRRHK